MGAPGMRKDVVLCCVIFLEFMFADFSFCILAILILVLLILWESID